MIDHEEVFTDPLTPIVLLERTLRVFPRRTAVVYEHERLDYAAFGRLVGTLASALRRAGVARGDRVAVLAPNTPLHLAAHFAAPLLGAPLVSINTRLASAEIAYILEHAGAKLLLVDPELAPKLDPVRASLRGLERVVELGDAVVSARPGAESYANFSVDAEPLPIVSDLRDELDVLSINYTSGTTGMPKGVMYTHRGATLNALTAVGSNALTKESVFLWTLPMFHCNGWCFPWAVTSAGGTHVCLRRVDPGEILTRIREERVTHFNGAPTVLLMLGAHPDAASVRFDPVVRVATGGAPPSPTLLERMEEMGVRVQHLYGLTETYGPHVLCEAQSEWDTLDRASRARMMARQGVPYAHAVYLRVVDAEMRDVPADGATLGEVVMRGNNVMRGYYRDPDATAKSFEGGWFHSGDVGVMHSDGYVELKDRSKDIIISGGENISTIEVEHAIVKHPAVLECAVVPAPDDRWGEVPVAYVSLRPDAALTERELVDHCRALLAHFKCPKAVRFGELPKTATGKIQKFRLREAEWRGYEKRIH